MQKEKTHPYTYRCHCAVLFQTMDKSDQPESSDEQLRLLVAAYKGKKLPGEREISVLLGISRPKVRQMISVLERERLVTRRQGSGTYGVDPDSCLLGEVTLLIDPDLKLGEDPFFSSLVEAVTTALHNHGIRCRLSRIDSTNMEQHDSPLITFGEAGSDFMLGHDKNAVPVVGMLLHESAKPSNRASIIQWDDYSGGRTAAQWLQNKGCASIIALGLPTLKVSSERMIGARSYCTEKSMRFSRIDCRLNYAAGTAIAQDVCTSLKPNTGVVCSNDWQALGLRAGLTALGLSAQSVPIASFDGLAQTNAAELNIGSLRIPLECLAVDAVVELQRLSTPSGAIGRTLVYGFVVPSNV